VRSTYVRNATTGKTISANTAKKKKQKKKRGKRRGGEKKAAAVPSCFHLACWQKYECSQTKSDSKPVQMKNNSVKRTSYFQPLQLFHQVHHKATPMAASAQCWMLH